ncbi:MAG: polysaccharide biosynthesis protein [Nitrospirae bacterium]|nr:polysaccharide biosynthesis protein [Nitrospirota bacterium]
MSLSEKQIKNIFIYVLPKFVGYGLNLLTLPILTRLLSPDDFGVIVLALAFPTIAVAVVTAGVPSSVPRYYFEYRKDEVKLNMLYFSAQLYLLTMFVASTAAVYFAKDFISVLVTGAAVYGSAVFISYLTAYLGQVNQLYLLLYQNMEKAALHSAFVFLQVLTSVLLSLILVWYFKMSYMGMIYGSFAGSLISNLAMAFHFNRSVKPGFSRKLLVENIKYGLQVLPKSFTGFINRFFDKYMLNAMLSMSVAGVYSIGQTITNAIDVLMSNAGMAFRPVIYKEVFDKGDKASSDVGRLFSVFSFMVLMPLLLVILFAEEVIYIIAPPSYYGAINIIVILAAGLATQTFGKSVGVQYEYSKKPFLIFPVTVVSTIINIVLNIFLIPRYGLAGAGFSAMASLSAMNFMFTYIGQKLYRIQYEWKTIISMYALIISAMLTILYFREIGHGRLYFYAAKLIYIVLFVLVGMRAKILTKASIAKVSGILFKTSPA